jgi:fimbrial chaperone protein
MFLSFKKKNWALASLLLGLALCQAEKTWASAFSVNPVKVFVSPQASSTLLTLHNESSEALRFQLSAFVWSQNSKGEMQLTPTQDVIFFPSLLTLAPGEERKIRVATNVTAGAVEKTYRLFFDELPPLENSQDSQKKNQVVFLTKIGIPIFVQPAQPVAEGKLQGLAAKNGRFSFQVKNTGNVHLSPQAIRVKGYDAAQKSVFERDLEAWYVLAGGDRAFEVDLPKADCSKIKTLTAEFQTEQTTLKETIDIPQGACGL